MPGIGTLINAAAVLIGGGIGLGLRRGLPARFQRMMMQALGLATLFIGISGTLEKMLAVTSGGLQAQGTLLTVLSLALGALIGEAVNIERQFEKLGEWLKTRFGRDSDSRFLEGFLTSSLTICFGAMAIVGALQDGLVHDPSMLITKAILDGIIIMIFASALGRGAVFSVIPLVLFQGSITFLAQWIAPLLSEAMIADCSMVGSMLIFCVGVNLMFETKIKVANLLPSLIAAMLLSLWL